MRALALISGGLDSILAAAVVKGLGIGVIGVYYKMPFSYNEKRPKHRSIEYARRLCEKIGIELVVSELKEEFLEIVRNPKFGFGTNANPCIDCKILMLKKAALLLKERSADFVVTGEVLGQRPMSQNRNNLSRIEQESGLKGLILRPLSARLLDITIPEEKGWVDREKLLDLNGRSRSPQERLAEKFGIKDYPQPAGGCLLTDPMFTRRVEDLLSHNELTLDNVELLKFGRHFRISDSAKLAVGRDESENEALERLAKKGDYFFYPPSDAAGPTALARGLLDKKSIESCASAMLRYCDTDTPILYKRPYSSSEVEIKLEVKKMEEGELDKIRI